MRLPANDLEPESVTASWLLSNSFYEVPDNQRDFKWGPTHFDRFWEDLTACVREDYDANRNHRLLGHFLGTIFVIANNNSSDPLSRHKVIDGQQRLTTITCLASVLLEFVKQHSDEVETTELTSKLHQCISVKLAGQRVARLVLNRANDFYEESVVNRVKHADRQAYWATENCEAPAPRARIKEALEFFYAKTKDFLDTAGAISTSERDLAISNLVYAFTDNFYALKLRVIDYRMVYRLFETLNERGLELSQADLIRNTILEAAERDGEASRKKAMERWSALVDQLDEQQESPKLTLPELIQFSYSSRHDSVSAEKLFDTISRQLQANRLSASDLADELARDAELWDQYQRGNQAYWEEEAKRSHRFINRVLWKKHAVPLILRLTDRFDQKPKKKELTKALWALECYLFRQGLIVGSSPADLERVLGEAARIVGKHEEAEDKFVSLLKAHSPEGPFKAKFETAEMSSTRGFYSLWRIENYLLQGQGIEFSPVLQSPGQHLEHILPKKPDASWGNIGDEEEFNILVNRLGNFLVLERKINQTVKNKSLNYKITNDKGRGYVNSGLKLPHNLIDNRDDWCSEGRWVFESIKKRQKHLSDAYASAVWKIGWG
jgi:hypothetical protein